MTTDVKDIIATLAQSAQTGIITPRTAAVAWEVPIEVAMTRLSRLVRRGWLRRVRRGVYQLLPLDASATSNIAYEDSWTLAASMFSPCYIGGWSAAEHWGLTEQLFRDTFVVTAANVRSTHMKIAGLTYRLVRVTRERAMGDTMVWRHATQVACASAERTLIDGANNPSWVGGIRHLWEMLWRYTEHPEHFTFDAHTFSHLMESHGRGAGAKRLGYLAERLLLYDPPPSARDILSRIIDVTWSRRSAGIIKLDPAVPSRGQINTRWRLWVNVKVAHDQ